jgi:hypothetical protein
LLTTISGITQELLIAPAIQVLIASDIIQWRVLQSRTSAYFDIEGADCPRGPRISCGFVFENHEVLFWRAGTLFHARASISYMIMLGGILVAAD